FIIFGLLGFGLLMIPFFTSVYPQIVEELEKQEIERRKKLPYEKPNLVSELQLSAPDQYLVTFDTTFFMRDKGFSHKIMEVNFGKNYLKVYDLSDNENITYSLLDKDTKDFVGQTPPLLSKTLLDLYQNKTSQNEQLHYLGIIYQVIKSGNVKFSLATREEAIETLKTKTPKTGRGRPIRDNRGNLIIVLDTPKVVNHATRPIDITLQ
ncbi:MAG: hypothetical protein AAGM67_07025, partial [Bacteroidota bacterium]